MRKTVTANKNLKASVADGSAWSVMQGIGDNFISVFAVFLKATEFQIGLITSLCHLFSSVALLLGSYVLKHFRNRLKLVVVSTALQTFFWVLLALMALLNNYLSQAVLILVLLYPLSYAVGTFSSPLWTSLLRDLVPPEIRGRVFGFRNRAMIFALLLTVIVTGLILEGFREVSLSAGFGLIFMLAALARGLSTYYLTRHDNPEFSHQANPQFNFKNFLKLMPRTNFGRFVIFSGSFLLVSFTMSPFVVVYILRELNWNYHEYSLFVISSLLGQIVILNIWGRMSDLFGNKLVMILSSLVVALLPFGYLLSTSVWCIALLSFIGGIGWSGFNLAIANFLIDAVKPENLPKCYSYQALINSIGTLLGAFLGGLMLSFLQDHFDAESPYVILFAVSGVLRLGIIFIGSASFSEVRLVLDYKQHPYLKKISKVLSFRKNKG